MWNIIPLKGKKDLKLAKGLMIIYLDNYAPKLSDSILPISKFLINQVKRVSAGKRYL